MPLGHDLAAMAQLINERTRLVFVANPNNPTGHMGRRATRCGDSSRRCREQTLVVVDEAYIEYVERAGLSRMRAAGSREFPNLVVTRTFSKAYGLAGLRVGYALSHPSVADMLNRVRQPFNVNSIALAAALAALDDSEHLQRSVETQSRRHGAAAARASMRSACVICRRAGNFVLIDCGRPAAPVYEAMLRQGVIVRPVGNYQLPNHLRMTIGTREQNERMLTALEQALAVLMTDVSRSSRPSQVVRARSASPATSRSRIARSCSAASPKASPRCAAFSKARTVSRPCARCARSACRSSRRVRAKMRVRGVGVPASRQPSHALDMGNSGTAMRLMTGLLAGQSFDSELIGDSSLMKRPMERVATPLRQMGARIETLVGQAAGADLAAARAARHPLRAACRERPGEVRGAARRPVRARARRP